MLIEVMLIVEVEFYNDDFVYGYFDVFEWSEIMFLDDGCGDVGVGDFVIKLDSFDDFFDELFSF